MLVHVSECPIEQIDPLEMARPFNMTIIVFFLVVAVSPTCITRVTSLLWRPRRYVCTPEVCFTGSYRTSCATQHSQLNPRITFVCILDKVEGDGSEIQWLYTERSPCSPASSGLAFSCLCLVHLNTKPPASELGSLELFCHIVTTVYSL